MKAGEQANIEFLIQLANNYARDNNYFKLAKFVKDIHPILKDHRDRLHPFVISVLDHYHYN